LEEWARGAHFLREDMNTIHTRERELHREVASRVADAMPEVEVLAVELRGPEHLAVYLDRPGGVDHELCARVTNVLRDYLNAYSLEVSSPGLERPLRTRSHFEQAVGRRVSIRTAGRKKRLKAEVVRAGEGAVTLAAGDEIDVPYDEIVRGNLIDEGAKR
jgi:ribosome maturation factor RimP